MPDEGGKPFAIAVGTDRQNSIYVCKLVDQGPCPILRHFRGHYDYVTSLGISRDLRYLVSGSADGTIRFWSLSGCTKRKQINQPLGCGIYYLEQHPVLLVDKIDPAGPLYQKGVHKGDVIESIRWPADGNDKSVFDCEKMIASLSDMAWGTQIIFAPARHGKMKLEEAAPPSNFCPPGNRWPRSL